MQRPNFFSGIGVAVLVIDMQPVFINGEKNKEDIIPNQLVVLKRCIESGVPVFIIEYEAFSFEGTIKDVLDVLPNAESGGYVKITKRAASSFAGTELEKALDNLGISTLILMGISTCGCVFQTAFDAKKLGYDVITAKNLMAASCSHCNPKDGLCDWFFENSKHFESHDLLMKYLESNFSGYRSKISKELCFERFYGKNS